MAKERYWVYYNQGSGLVSVMPYDPDALFPWGDVTKQNQAPSPHHSVVGDYATEEEAEEHKAILEEIMRRKPERAFTEDRMPSPRKYRYWYDSREFDHRGLKDG